MRDRKERTLLNKLFNEPADYDRFDDLKAAEVQQLIDSGNLAKAKSKLDALSGSDENSSWDYTNHRSAYLQGQIEYKEGRLHNAYTKYQQAHSQQPHNPIYIEALQAIEQQRNREPNAFAPPKPEKTKSSCCDWDDCCDICGCC